VAQARFSSWRAERERKNEDRVAKTAVKKLSMAEENERGIIPHPLKHFKDSERHNHALEGTKGFFIEGCDDQPAYVIFIGIDQRMRNDFCEWKIRKLVTWPRHAPVLIVRPTKWSPDFSSFALANSSRRSQKENRSAPYQRVDTASRTCNIPPKCCRVAAILKMGADLQQLGLRERSIARHAAQKKTWTARPPRVFARRLFLAQTIRQ
jgi:hypothetical protein